MPCQGPMGRNVEDMVLIMKAQLTEKAYKIYKVYLIIRFKRDPLLLNKPFSDSDFNSTKKLRIGYFKT